ncbi:MAG: hypothetical protein OHK006_03400 [Thermodesulfovibrionales bacterium]
MCARDRGTGIIDHQAREHTIMEPAQNERELDWLYPFRKKFIIGLSGLLTASISITLLCLLFTLRGCLEQDTTRKTEELGAVIEAVLTDHMLERDPHLIQHTFDGLGRSGSSVKRAFLLDLDGRVAYSTDPKQVGVVYDRLKDPSCTGCHGRSGTASQTTIITPVANGDKVQRVVRIIHNQPACYGCHAPILKVNGKLIIDRSLAGSRALLSSVAMIVLASGAICLAFVIPFAHRYISRGLNTYISEILKQHAERSLLYMMTERLSKTIDVHELESIIIGIVQDTFQPDRIDLVLSREDGEARAIAWDTASGQIDRKKIEDDGELQELLDQWNSGRLENERSATTAKRIVFPIGKGDRRFALIVARRNNMAFGEERLRLIRPMANHVAVALENAYLYYIAITDELTALFTQRHFRTSIDREFEEFRRFGKRLSLLMLDLDDFKKVNDTYGHPAGDHILQGVASCVRNSIRDNDLAFRYGGEEFAVLLPATDSKGAMFVAERIRQNISKTVFEETGRLISVTVSIGVGACPEHAETIKDLILQADTALYEAKRTGKNRVASALA